MNELTTIVSTVGFPIAMCIILAWYVKYLTDGFIHTIEINTQLLTEIKVLLQSTQVVRKVEDENK